MLIRIPEYNIYFYHGKKISQLLIESYHHCLNFVKVSYHHNWYFSKLDVDKTSQIEENRVGCNWNARILLRGDKFPNQELSPK